MNERRHAGERRSGEAQLRAILDGALDAVVGMDAKGRITFWNPQAERLSWLAGRGQTRRRS